MSRLPKQDWVDEDAVAGIDPPDPLRSVFARNRARRGGTPQTPPAEPMPSVQEVTPPSPTGLADRETGGLCLLFAANASLSGTALKVLVAALERGQDASTSLSQFMQMTKLTKNTVIVGIRECLDWGWITRRQACSRCGAALLNTDGERVVACQGCGRKVPPQPYYTVQNPNRAVQILNSPVETIHSPVEKPDSLPAQYMDNPVQNMTSPAVKKIDSPPVQNMNRYKKRIGSIISRAVPDENGEYVNPVQNMNRPVDNPHRSRARADSESVTRIKDSDSRIPAQPGSAETGRVVYASGEWQQITEKLAKDCAKRIGDKSIGFHVKVWAHARKVDWEKGGRRFEEALLAIAQELEGKHNATGKSQGALWTKMVRRYFEEKSCPLLTEAEAEEWKELHGSYAPPTL